jgi:predicted membrane protein (TIGR00267 family)
VDDSSSTRDRLAGRINNVREYERITGFGKIARRALANNSFDGVLTMIGVLMGNFVKHETDPSKVITVGITTSLSIGISGLWGAYLAESAERGRELAQMERASLTDLSRTKIGRASRTAVVVVALVDGLSPFLSSLIVLAPLTATPLLGSITAAYVLCFVVALVGLFGLGMFLGHISGRSLVGYGVRTAVAGITAMAISELIAD